MTSLHSTSRNQMIALLAAFIAASGGISLIARLGWKRHLDHISVRDEDAYDGTKMTG